MEDRRHPNVVNLREVEAREYAHGEKFACRTRWVTEATGATGLGCSWYEVPPGRTAFPQHFHCANHEALFILGGRGTLRIGEERVPVAAGDYATLPPGPQGAHQWQNTGEGPLTYLCISTMVSTDVVGYPDSRKTAALAFALGTAGETPWVRAMFRNESVTDYYDREDGRS
jgi:uncharacterized cupin superfamily protein